jgi:hypothetical protein
MILGVLPIVQVHPRNQKWKLGNGSDLPTWYCHDAVEENKGKKC